MMEVRFVGFQGSRVQGLRFWGALIRGSIWERYSEGAARVYEGVTRVSISAASV